MYIYLTEYPRSNGTVSLYIGQSIKKPEETEDYFGSGIFPQNYEKKYGKEYVRQNVKKKILLRDLPSQEALDYWEKFSIRDYRDRFPDQVMNIADGGDGINGLWESEEFRAKMEKIRKSPEYRAKLSNAMKGRKLSEEHKRKISEIQIGKKLSEEHKRKIGEAGKGRKHSEEVRAKISDGNKDTTIHTFRNICTGELFTGVQYDFTKKYRLNNKKVSLLVLGKANHHRYWVLNHSKIFSTDCLKRLRSDTMKNKKHSEETKRKLSDINKGKKHPQYNHKIYNFKNLNTNQTFTGTRNDFQKTCDLSRTSIHELIHKKIKSRKGWILVTDSKDK